jgi:hypothetical protein
MSDPTEGIRREMVEAINSGLLPPEGKEWTTEELKRDFEVLGFLAPFVIVKSRETGRKGTLMFRHMPRVYFDWRED